MGKLNNIPRALAEREIENESEEISNSFLSLIPGYYIALEERLSKMADLYLYNILKARCLVLLIG